MPRKIRELVAQLEKVGFVDRGGRPVVISGKLGYDAKHYQVRAVRLALKEIES